MSKTFNFNGTVTYNDSIYIEHEGNVALEATDTVGRSFFLVIRTALGESSYLEFGPLYKDEELLPEDTTIHFKRIEYSEYELDKVILKFLGPKKWIGNKKVPLEKVEIISVDLALSYGINPFKYLSEFSDTSNY